MLRRSILVAAIPYLLLVWKFNFLSDDAFISFRYSDHFAQGLGLRYNLGVDPPVEGYTNFLWVLMIGALKMVGISEEISSRVLSVGAGLSLLFLVPWVASRRLGVKASSAGMATLFLGTFPCFAVWSTGGLATLPFAALIFGLYAFLLVPKKPSLPLVLAIASGLVLLRADGTAYATMVLVCVLLASLLEKERARVRCALLAILAVIATTAGHIIFRLSYYGDFVPHTARAKVGFSGLTLERGFDYVLSFVLTFPSIALIFVVWIFFAKRSRWNGSLPTLLFLGVCAAAVLVGGDFMCFWRFLIPALPFAALVLASALKNLGERDGGLPPLAPSILVAGCVAVSVLPAFNLHLVPESIRETVHYRWGSKQLVSEFTFWEKMNDRQESWAKLGRALAANASPEDSVVLAAIGAAGYYSGLFVFDRFGLVSPEVTALPGRAGRKTAGHEKMVSPEFFLEQKPTILEAVIVDKRNPSRTRTEINFKEPRIQRDYEVKILTLSDEFGKHRALRLIRKKKRKKS